MFLIFFHIRLTGWIEKTSYKLQKIITGNSLKNI